MTAKAMQVELHDKDGKFIASLTDDLATLEHLGICDGNKFIIQYFFKFKYDLDWILHRI